MQTTTFQRIFHRLLRHAHSASACAALCAWLALPAHGAAPGPDGNRGHMNRLLHNPTVIQHLGLSDRQASAAQNTSNVVVEQHRAAFEQASTYDTREERVAHVARTFVSITDQTFDQLRDVLSPAQHQRLQQIEIQTFALRAFGRPAVIGYLELTTAQQQALKTIASEAGEQSKENFQSKTRSAAEKAQQGQKIRATALQNARAQLSAEQWVKWELLTGAAFTPS